jgi:aminomethyltransferase
MAVRTQAGLFDASHMGELFLSGPDALDNLNRLLTNDFTTMAEGRVRYSLLLNDDAARWTT